MMEAHTKVKRKKKSEMGAAGASGKRRRLTTGTGEEKKELGRKEPQNPEVQKTR